MQKQFAIEISKVNRVLTYNWDELPEASQEHVIHYGLTQYLNDGHAFATAKAFPVEADQMREAGKGVDARDQNLRTGNFARRSRGPDPIRLMAAKYGYSDAQVEAMFAEAAAKTAPKKKVAA